MPLKVKIAIVMDQVIINLHHLLLVAQEPLQTATTTAAAVIIITIIIVVVVAYPRQLEVVVDHRKKHDQRQKNQIISP